MFSYGVALENKRNEHNTYWGKYPAQITKNDDPDGRGRVKFLCPSVLSTIESDWAEGCFPPGYFFVPPKGSYIWVEFFQGDPHKPIWSGQFYPQGTVPTAIKVARLGDQVTVTGSDPQGGSITSTGTITSVSSAALITG